MGRGACLERALPEERGREDAIDACVRFQMTEHVRESVAHGFLGGGPATTSCPASPFDEAYVCLHLGTPYYARVGGQKTSNDFRRARAREAADRRCFEVRWRPREIDANGSEP